MFDKYAKLLTEYCVDVQPGDRVLIRTNILSKPLLLELCKEISLAGGHPVLDISIQGVRETVAHYSDLKQLEWINPLNTAWANEFEGYMHVRAPQPKMELPVVSEEKKDAISKANRPIREKYFERTGNLSMKRTLCEFPTETGAARAGMSLEDYSHFIFNACKLNEDNPTQAWRDFGKNQQREVDFLNSKSKFRYLGPNVDLTFSTKGRTWINSDGKTNMPSGEIYTSPVDDSTNGWVKFTMPSIYEETDFEGMELEFKDGVLTSHSSSINNDKFTEIVNREGANRLGEIAIGTNYDVKTPSKNILFDEKIGGTIHMALGEAYRQCGGINKSHIHWDLITDMTTAEIYADDEIIYKNGKFIF